MATVVLGSLEVRVALDGLRRLPDERGGGGLRRTVNGQLRGRSDWVKGGWSCVLLAIGDAELAAVRAAANPDVSVQVSGSAFPAPFWARVEITGDIEHVRTGPGVMYRIPTTIREV